MGKDIGKMDNVCKLVQHSSTFPNRHVGRIRIASPIRSYAVNASLSSLHRHAARAGRHPSLPGQHACNHHRGWPAWPRSAFRPPEHLRRVVLGGEGLVGMPCYIPASGARRSPLCRNVLLHGAIHCGPWPGHLDLVLGLPALPLPSFGAVAGGVVLHGVTGDVSLGASRNATVALTPRPSDPVLRPAPATPRPDESIA
eukprot:gene12992-biopygen7325